MLARIKTVCCCQFNLAYSVNIWHLHPMRSSDAPPIPTRPVAVDIATFRLVGGRLHILLVKRKYPPFQGQWVLPGGFVGSDETVSAAATREMIEETGFDIRHLHLEQMKVYSEPKRDPRGPIISISFLAVVPGDDPKAEQLQANTDAADARWFDIEDLPNLGFDHDKIATAGIGRLLRRVLEDPLTRRIIPPPLLRARIDDLARGGAVARHFQRRMQRIMEATIDPPQSRDFVRGFMQTSSESPAPDQMPSDEDLLDESADSKERIGRLYELMAADSKPAERPHPLAMLLPKTFTLPELRQFFELMLDETIDRGNFRRRISELIAFGALDDLGETKSEGRGRPAELYRLDSNRLRRFLDTDDKK
ncbi:MAG: hypothetical protein CMJ30_06725 [Phycisphaerae bacterium]|nr:hypothetical protein [Phycisphaerae bacterium]